MSAANPRVFISYRREDSAAEAREICTALTVRSGPESVFLDERRIDAGGKRPEEIRAAHSDADTILVVVKHWAKWLGVDVELGVKPRRIDLTDDWVRQEVAFAIEQDQRTKFPGRDWTAGWHHTRLSSLSEPQA